MDNWMFQEQLSRETAIVVPVYYARRVADDVVRQLIRMTLVDCPHYVPSEQVWIVVDGDPRSAAIVGEIVDDLAAAGHGRMQLIAPNENEGKLGAMRRGMRAILQEQPQIRYLGVLDGDADHLISVLPQLVRAAAFLEDVYGHGRVVAIGARASRTRPMGWVRGELERLIDQLTVDALGYALARQGRVLDLSQCPADYTPDLSSGYKVYGRELAEILFDGSPPRLETLSSNDYWHYGPETVSIVETVLAGGVFGEVRRPTWDGQPVTSFGDFGVVAMYGELLAWVWARLQIPVDAAIQMYDNRRNKRALATAAEGAELVRALRHHALERLAVHRNKDMPDAPRATLPFI